MPNYKIPSIKKIIFTTSLNVRISDINYGNHLGHDSVVSLLHEARVRFLRKIGYINELDVNGLEILVTTLVVNYINESFYSDKLLVNIEIGEISKTSLQLIYQVMSNNNEIVRALTVITFYNKQKRKVDRIPKSFLISIEL